jgi:hypothetical protein
MGYAESLLEDTETEAFRVMFGAMKIALGANDVKNMNTDGMTDEQLDKLEDTKASANRRALAACHAVFLYIEGISYKGSAIITDPESGEELAIPRCNIIVLPRMTAAARAERGMMALMQSVFDTSEYA